MTAPAPHFRGFLRSVHRRLVVVRAAERTGLGVLAGCVAAGVLLPLLYWGGQAAVVPSLFLLGLGTIAGIAWGVASRPSVLVAAMEADRQLGLADLLGTAAACHARPDADDPWRITVLAVADDRCRQLAPSQVVLNRLGARAWGGIGLAAALVLTLAALTGNPADLRATPARGVNAATGPMSLHKPDPQRDRSAPASHPRPMSRARPDGSSEGGSSDQAMTSVHLSPLDPSAGQSNPSASAGRLGAAGDEGVGGGTGRARQPQPLRPSAAAPDSAASVTRSPDSANSQQVGGSGRASAAPPSSRDRTDVGGTSAGASAVPPDRVPPWHSQSWPADRRAAAESLDAGRVPDACRDLVRDYFDRP